MSRTAACKGRQGPEVRGGGKSSLELVGNVGSVAHEPAIFDMLAITINRRQTCPCREVGNLPTSRIKGCVRRDEQRFNTLPAKHRERRVNLVRAANLHWLSRMPLASAAILVSRSCGTCRNLDKILRGTP